MPTPRAIRPGQYSYVPTDKQQLAHNSLKKYVLFGGARGPGKSRWLLEHIKTQMLRWPGLPVFLGRRDLSDLKKTTEVEWTSKVCEPWLYDGKSTLRALDWKGREYDTASWGGVGQHHKSENWYRLANGSTLYLGELKDWESWRSATLGLIAFDEAVETEE